jgi:hypothetical protein
LVFFDDILVNSSIYEDYLIHLEQVFQLLHQDQWKVELSKCTFAKKEISYLGYIINAKGASTCPNKITAVAE